MSESVSKPKDWQCPACLANVAKHINHYCVGNGNRIPNVDEGLRIAQITQTTRVQDSKRPTANDVGNFSPTVVNLFHVLEAEYMERCRVHGPTSNFAIGMSKIRAVYDKLRYHKLHRGVNMTDAEQLFFVALALADETETLFEVAIKMSREDIRPITMDKKP